MAAANIEKSSSHARSVKNSLQHTWIIENFSVVYFKKQSTLSTDPEYPCIASPVFQCLKDTRIQFRIYLYSKGDKEENQDYISVFLSMKFKKPVQIPIRFKLSILSGPNQVGHSAEISQMFTETVSYGWPKFIEQNDLLDKTKGLLPDDQLTLLLEVDLYSKPTIKSTIDANLENLKSLSIAKNGQLYGSLLESGEHSDVLLVLDGGKELKAHKLILSTHSPVFKAMLECDMKEKAEGRVVIEDLSIEVAKELLKFIYTGKVDSLDTLAEELLTAADKYGLDLLKQICCEYLCAKVATNTVARFLALAEAHSVDKLKSTCMEYIRDHLAQVMLTQDWPLVHQLVIEEMRKEMLPQEEEKEKETPKKLKSK